jgi:AraC-like DNA-binding protein
VRTFIRKLKVEETSYQSLLDEVRKELVVWYLSNGSMTIEQIADQLGYADTSNFSRVFRRWFNQTPSEFRTDHVPPFS